MFEHPSRPGRKGAVAVSPGPGWKLGSLRRVSELSSPAATFARCTAASCTTAAQGCLSYMCYHLQSSTITDTDANIGIGYISKAMSILRSLPASEDTVLCHTLGSILAFSVYSAIGVGVPDICRYCLGTTSSFVGTTISKDPWQNLLVLRETMDCLVYRQNPAFRIKMPAPGAVDRHLGLSLPLMPYYHDLCVISNSLLNTTDVSTLARLQKQIDDIQSVVEPWQPSNLD
jgi:hypothetical protein